MKVAVDIMGGDQAPSPNVQGIKLALKDFPQIKKLLLVGDTAVVQAELSRQKISKNNPRLELVHASQVVCMDEASSVALRAKKDSSIAVAARLLNEKRADAIVSAGHTGATVACTVVRNRTLKGIQRPGIAILTPAPEGPFLLLDAGATVDCKPINLAQYAILGEAYSRHILHVPEPKVGILSVGGEDGKGNELTRESFKLLQRMPVNFIGNVEGHDLFSNQVDVVVCDGFVGNVVLKSAESLAKALSIILKRNLRKSPMRMAGALLSKNAFRELRELTDHEEYGGAPLLGINGTCIIAHGSSSPKAVRNAIRVATEMVQENLNKHVSDKIADIQWEEILADAAR